VQHRFRIATIGLCVLFLRMEVSRTNAAPQEIGETRSPVSSRESDGSGAAKWDWRPWWRSKSDCGPVALYALLSLEGFAVDFKTLSTEIPLDPVRGCSLGDLRRAASTLGVPTETRFVNPNALAKLRMPFILHGNQSIENDFGHFVVVVAYDREKDLFAIVDPIRQSLNWGHGGSLRRDFSGYAMQVKEPFFGQRWLSSASGYAIATIAVLTATCLVINELGRSVQPPIISPATAQSES